MRNIRLGVNGLPVQAAVEPRTHLADFLREQQMLTGTHLGCEHGICGACTVVIDGEIARSCITYAVQCDGAEVTTIEGFDDDPLMQRLREAFRREHGLQCGYCTPGMLITARDLVRRVCSADEQQVRVAMSGNLCRCTGYVGIVRAIRSVMAEAVDASVPPPSRAGNGPAPGPDAERTATPPDPTRAPTGATAAEAPGRAWGEPVEDIADESLTRLQQSFTVAFPPARVWEFLGDLRQVAGCLPGAAVSRIEGERFAGEMRVRLGPMRTAFAAEGRVSRDEAAQRARVQTQGHDTLSGSRMKGRIDYAVSGTADGGSRVDIEVGYALAGMLAQFGRGALVGHLAERLSAEFARNMAARLADPGTAAPAAGESLGALALLWSVIRARLHRLFRAGVRGG